MMRCDVAGRRCCSVEPSASQASEEHSWREVGEDEDGDDRREARPTWTGRTIRSRNPGAAALIQLTTPRC